jgi:DNA (cytosine-5)-methyltransferase 1
MEEIKVLELFGGIGACTKALKRLEIPHKVVDYVEIDKYAVASYNAINGTNFEPQDICEWNKDIEVDLIMHGSPCQDFSLAGKQAGGDKESGTRSSLMYETIRIVEKLKPKYVIWENVKNLLSKKHIHNFNAYLETMEQLGYTNYYQVLNAKNYGIPQNRERVFTVSIRKDIDKGYTFPVKQDLKLKLKDMLEDEVDDSFYWNKISVDKLRKLNFDDITFKWNSKVKRFVFNENIDLNMTYSLNAYNNSVSCIHHTITTPHNVLFILHKGKIRKILPKEAWRLMGFDDEDYNKADKVNSNTQLYKQAGNSIVVNVLEAILTNLLIDNKQEITGQTNIYDFMEE